MPDRDDDWERCHLHALFFNDDALGLCGCGNPEDAYNLVRDLLDHMHERGTWERFGELIGTTGAVHVVLSRLERTGLTEHGGVVHGSWLTGKGKYVRAMMHRHAWDDGSPDCVEGAGSPHWDGERCGECTGDCWTAPPGSLPPDPPGKSIEELREAIRREADEDRARMHPVQRAVSDAVGDAMENYLLWGAPVAPPNRMAGLPGPFARAAGPFPGHGRPAPAGGAEPACADAFGLVEGVELARQELLDSYGLDPGEAQDLRRRESSQFTATQCGCYRHEAGTWIHGWPHTCPTWVRR